MRFPPQFFNIQVLWLTTISSETSQMPPLLKSDPESTRMQIGLFSINWACLQKYQELS